MTSETRAITWITYGEAADGVFWCHEKTGGRMHAAQGCQSGRAETWEGVVHEPVDARMRGDGCCEVQHLMHDSYRWEIEIVKNPTRVFFSWVKKKNSTLGSSIINQIIELDLSEY